MIKKYRTKPVESENGLEREEFIEGVIPGTVGQYTGKTDNNKTRVFDGDIIRIFNAKQPLDVGVVRWNDDDQCYVVCSTWSKRCILTDFRNIGRSKFEVIGNIHDNPELLEVNK